MSNGPRFIPGRPGALESERLRLWVFGVLIVGLATPLRTGPAGRLGDLHRRDARARGIVGCSSRPSRAAACPRSAVLVGAIAFSSSARPRAEVTA